MGNKKNILLCGANGYIGSLFYEKFKNKYNLFPIDNLLNKRKKSINFNFKDYKNLNKKILNKFQICLWLCGHSSVKQSISDPKNALDNNFLGLIELSKIFRGTIIYASSGSVYNNINKKCNEKTILREPSNVYDLSKFLSDNYFKSFNKKYISLRFGTVVGASKSFRKDLLLNKMSLDAIKNKKIKLSNPNSLRPILYIEDLMKAIDYIIPKHKELRKNIFNLSSCNYSIKTYAKYVSSYYKVKIKKMPNSKTYSFSMDNAKFIKKSKVKFTYDINEILKNIEEHIRKNKL